MPRRQPGEQVKGDAAAPRFEAPLLRSKLTPPAPRRDSLRRPRLEALLLEAPRPGLTLLSAPAGFGKSTLLAQWAAAAGQPVAWLSLDEMDNDPARFARELAAALETAGLRLAGDVHALLQARQPLPPQAILAELLNSLNDRTEPFALLLDDYQAIDAAPVHAAVTLILDHLPPAVRLLIATRADPPLPLARLRARGLLQEIRARDLRFAIEECAAFLNELRGLGLSTEQIAALEARTEGWAAGLHLAALSMQRHPDPAEFVRDFSGSHRYVLDYLAEEVLGRLPPATHAFLLETAPLTRLSGPLCAAVLGWDDADAASRSQALLEELERSNLFLMPLDEQRSWYRYHPLFADLLRARLQQSQPGRLPVLQARAAAWCAREAAAAKDEHLAREAIAYALAARDFALAAGVIETHALAWLMRGEWSAFLDWVAALPPEVVSVRPRLLLYRAATLGLRGQATAAAQVLRQAERLVESMEPAPERAQLQGYIAAIRVANADAAGDVPRALALAREALDRLPAYDFMNRTTALFALGHAHFLQGDLAAATEAWSAARHTGETTANLYAILLATAQLGKIHRIAGRLVQTAAEYREALERGAALGGRRFLGTGLVRICLADILREWNQIETAEHEVLEGLAIEQPYGNGSTLAFGHVTLARVRQARGDLAGAGDALRKALDLIKAAQIYPEIAAQARAAQVAWWLAQGDLASAVAHVHALEPAEATAPEIVRELDELVHARVQLAQGEADAAARRCAQLARAAEPAGRRGRLVEILAVQALAHHACRHASHARLALVGALALAAPERYTRVFLDEGTPMAELLATMSAAEHAAYVQELLAAFGRGPAAIPAAPAAPLTLREIEVLRLVAAGMTNAEIAQELVVAIGTVRAHTAGIFRKLDVRNRTEAVARARALKLL